MLLANHCAAFNICRLPTPKAIAQSYMTRESSGFRFKFCCLYSHVIQEVDIGLAADVGTLQRLPKVIGNRR